MAFLLLTFSFALTVFDITHGLKNVPSQTVEALSGETIYLPCNVSTNDGDEVVLVLWYREDKGTPIYSVDIREGSTKAVKRWSDETVFGERAYFIFDKEPGTLSIQNIRFTDSGIYRCRVDFLKAQTRNSKITLSVIAPAESVIIRDDSDIERSTVVGPYSEGDKVTLKCNAIGGKPVPTLSWYRDDSIMDSHVKTVPGEGSVRSEINLGPLSRKDLNARITCKANNHPRAAPVESVVQIDMNFSPLNIRLLGAHQPLSAGRRYDLLCQSSGSRPPAVITWWLDGLRLERTTETTSSDGNQTTSTLSITFNKKDAGKLLTCKAYNHAVPSEPLEDGWKLDIQYVPEAYVQLGTSLDKNSIREGTDVYFDCMVFSHPIVFRIEWRHNGNPLPRNISQGVIVSNHSLVLQGVTRSTAGNYSCVGYNVEGEGISDPFSLNILFVDNKRKVLLYPSSINGTSNFPSTPNVNLSIKMVCIDAPTCVPNQPRIYGVAKQEDAKIKCSVDANPPDVDFSWTFNNSAESIDVATNHISRLGTSSTVTYTPITELDYGTLLCVATNIIGKQRIPCIFHIIAAGRPDQVHNCTLTNISMTSLTVTCTDGFNGGLPQLFVLELLDTQSSEIKANITSTIPRFTVSTLSPGGVYTLSVYAFNSKGRSDPTIINAAMLRMPEKQLTFEQGDNSRTGILVSPFISLSVGLTLAVLIAGLAIILALRIPYKSAHRQQKEFSNEQDSRNVSPGPSEKSSGSKELEGNDDDKNPDVIPETMEPCEQFDYMKNKQKISTIESSCSPTRNLLSNTPPPRQYSAGVTLHSSHNLGYCTLRSGIQNSSIEGALSVNVAPHVYSSSIAQCTLPRHTSHNLWSNYNTVITGIHHVQPTTTMHQQSLPTSSKIRKLPMHTEPLNISAAENVILTANVSSINNKPHNFLQEHIQVHRATASLGMGNSGKQTIEPACLSDEEVTAQTPLMMKRESSV